MQFGKATDEIKLYLDAHYVSSCEAQWRLYLFEMQEHVPTVVHLQIHLPEEQAIVFNADEAVDNPNLENVLARYAGHDTTLTGWFKANAQAQNNDIRDTLYQNFPFKMVWNKGNYKWTVRKDSSFAIGRMYYIHPTAGEKFYLRLLLTTIKGATSWDDLYSFEGTQYPSFKEACIAHGLLEDDQEWHQCLEEARHMQSGRQLCHLFVTIIKDCIPSAPRELWDTFWPHICDDIRHMLQNHANIPEPSDVVDCVHDIKHYKF